MSEWQPIATAPLLKVGEAPMHALVYGRDLGRVWIGSIGRYGEDYLFAGVAHIAGNLAADLTVTHWMPLPAPPDGSTR